ncbi:antA/AntB antirepressor family protein [Clostridioides difficile]|uniref:antA/AntB antirepressor family protein n=1 Tax=Clostridioides difficile TaxID=1496 RepID=UPI00093A606E|nr:antA/AntB antirepressor family protein [Clostridioides difficile]EGT4187541.1 phage antirepressor Ant [Clostridioides difficile]MDL0336817.1 antA/AntB antirepressor family protein [Clostridioides difficile]VHX56709.1 anti-repressor [Clostridioides difficile]HBF2285665.1 antA/AntB antirepressor family protein [Clostridioides difficile]HBF3734833.1 antA/AntB antirepressor family protein [Clostridioides difficile]
MNEIMTNENLRVVADDLVTVYETDTGEKIVFARELHNNLEVKRQFIDWIEDRIKQYGFKENEDYSVFHKNMKNSTGGRPSKEYVLKLDVAKELAMVQNNNKGREIRRYFIRLEKLLNRTLSNSQLSQINTIVNESLLKMEVKHNIQIEQLKKECSEYYRPTSKTKYDISSYIKERLGISKVNEEFELVKKRTLLVLGADKWEDIPKDVLLNSLNLIDESIRIIKSERKTNQITFFEKDNFC